MTTMKKLFTPAFLAVFSFFVAQVAFKAATFFRDGTLLLSSEFIKLPLSSVLAICAADTIAVAASFAALVSCVTFMVNFISNAEAKNRETNKP